MINPAVRNSIRGSGRQAYPHQGSSSRLPKEGLLLYLGRPNLEASDVPLGDDTEIGDDTIIRWMFLLPADADIRAATGWISGTGNIFYDAAGDPIAVLASEIAAWSSINQWNVLFHLVSADTETGRLAIYTQDTPDEILDRALRVLREPVPDRVYPSAFFNGEDFRLATYTGGPTYVSDHLGVLRSPGANRWAVQGKRLATTVADGAVLGPEKLVNGDFSAGVTGWTLGTGWSVNSGTASCIGAIGPLSALTGVESGKMYSVTFVCTILAGVAIVKFQGGNEVTVSTTGTKSVTLTAAETPEFRITRSTAELTASFDNISIKKVTPIYLNIDESGNQIIPSTPQRTVTYNTDWTAKTFAETFDKFNPSDPSTFGWLCEPVRTNKVTCRKSNPVDTTGLTKSGAAAAILSVVDDTAALTAAGLIGICSSGKVYKLDNSLGVDYSYATISGGVGNTNTHSISIYGRITSGVGGIRLNSGAWSLTPAFSGGSVFIRYCGSNIIPRDTSRPLLVQANAGAVVYFILPQLEEGAFCTSPICKASDGSDPLTSLTRAATVASFPTAGKIPVNNFAIRMIVVPRCSYITQGLAHRLFSIYVDVNNRTSLIFDSSIDRASFTVRVAGSNVQVDIPMSRLGGVAYQLLAVKSSYGMSLTIRSHDGANWTVWSAVVSSETSLARSNIIVGSSYQIGSQNGAEQFTGNVSQFDCVPIPAGITDPMAWAKTHWGVA